MRHLFLLTGLFVVWCCPRVAQAQDEQKYWPPEIKKIHVGFQPYEKNEPSAYKVGLWTPIHVELFGGTDGIAPKGNRKPFIEIATVDSEDVTTQILVPVKVDPMQRLSFSSYVKTGHMGHHNNEITVTLDVNGQKYPSRSYEQFSSLKIDANLYLTLGSQIPDLHRAVQEMSKQNQKEMPDFRFEPSFRHVAHEADLKRLPVHWFGYNSVDMIFLTTEREFLKEFARDAEGRPNALAQWVRRGGRLIVPFSPSTREVTINLLKSKTIWDPPIPVIPPPEELNLPGKLQVTRLGSVAGWAGALGKPFENPDAKQNPITIVRLDKGGAQPRDWEVKLETDEDEKITEPLITRVRYGLGQIVYLAFSLEEAPFSRWEGKSQFFKKMVSEFGPRAPSQENDRGMGRFHGAPPDVTTDILVSLDNFDVTVIPFGYVALFIILYILVVGPLDFFLLKYVFKRLEWTWITFPTVVLGVSVIAYFAAYALKGRDLKVNKVDMVDFDLRTDLDAQRQTRSVHAYGQSLFTILSPRIQNYTIGLEPNPLFWGGEVKKVKVRGQEHDEVMNVDLMQWMGRPSGGPHEMRRSGSSGFFRRPYLFREDGAGRPIALEGVPIPVWTTKAFGASWEQTLTKPPFTSNLVYHLPDDAQGIEAKITGKLENHLGVDLIDTWLFYGKKSYKLSEGLPRGKPLTISILTGSGKGVREWVNEESPQFEQAGGRMWSANPTRQIKGLLFHEGVDSTNNASGNHLLRPLDLNWRIVQDFPTQRDRQTREAILFARVNLASGTAETVASTHPLPTKLWLGEIPQSGVTRPPLIGQMNQDTYIRVILPVQPTEK